jgi:hypothetical protein
MAAQTFVSGGLNAFSAIFQRLKASYNRRRRRTLPTRRDRTQDAQLSAFEGVVHDVANARQDEHPGGNRHVAQVLQRENGSQNEVAHRVNFLIGRRRSERIAGRRGRAVLPRSFRPLANSQMKSSSNETGRGRGASRFARSLAENSLLFGNMCVKNASSSSWLRYGGARVSAKSTLEV